MMPAPVDYRQLADAMPQIVWVARTDGGIEFFNRRWYEFSGQAETRLDPDGWLPLVHPDERAKAGAAWEVAVASGLPFEQEHRLRDARAGRFRWHLTRAAPVRDEQGRITRWFGTCTDIDDHKRGEVAGQFLLRAGAILSSSLDYETTLREVARLSVDGFADFCAVDLYNAADLERVAAAHKDPSKAHLAQDLSHFTPKLGDNSPYQRVLRSGQTLLQVHVAPEELEGSEPPAEHHRLMLELDPQSSILVPLRSGWNIIGIITLVRDSHGWPFDTRDISIAEELARRAAIAVENARLYRDTQRAKETAEEASRLKDDFLAIVSHELRTPLMAVLGWSNMLRNNLVDAALTPKGLEVIERAARTQAQLIDDLLDVSRIVAGKMRFEIGAVAVREIVDGAITSVEPAARAKNLRIETDIRPPDVQVQADPDRLQQVVWNLLSNAVKFTPRDGGEIRVEVQRHNEHVSIEVSDQGPGIEPEFLPHVFDRFRQGDSSTTRRHGGLGLGLAIVRHIIEGHGGHVVAESRGHGCGASFRVELPVWEAPATQEAELEVTPSAFRFTPATEATAAIEQWSSLVSGLHVLVVDDEADIREMARELLEAAGARVWLAESAQKAWSLWKQAPPDVLLCDIAMPDENGYSFIKRVRDLPPECNPGTPAIALTSYARSEDRQNAIESGFGLHIAKPVAPDALLAAIARISGLK